MEIDATSALRQAYVWFQVRCPSGEAGGMHSYFRVSDPAADGGSVGDTNDNALAETDIGLDGSRRAPRPVQNQRPARMGDHETGAPMQQGPTVQSHRLPDPERKGERIPPEKQPA